MCIVFLLADLFIFGGKRKRKTLSYLIPMPGRLWTGFVGSTNRNQVSILIWSLLYSCKLLGIIISDYSLLSTFQLPFTNPSAVIICGDIVRKLDPGSFVCFAATH